MTKFFNKFKKIMFLIRFRSIFPILGAKKFFPENMAVMHNFLWVSSKMPKFRKNWWYNSKKTPGQKEERTEGQTEGWMDRPYFTRPFRLPLGIQWRPYFWNKTNKNHMVSSQLCSPISSCFPVLPGNFYETFFNKLRTSLSTGEE